MRYLNINQILYEIHLRPQFICTVNCIIFQISCSEVMRDVSIKLARECLEITLLASVQHLLDLSQILVAL